MYDTDGSNGQVLNSDDLIPDILPRGSMCLLSGPAHSGKTAFIASELARWINTGLIFGRPAPLPKAFLLLAVDHKLDHNQRRWFARAGIADKVRMYSLRDNSKNVNWGRLRTTDGRRGLFKDSLKELAPLPGSLLIGDSIGTFIASKLADYNQVAAGLGEISQALDEWGLTLWGTVHTAKQLDDPRKTYKRAIDRVLGSGGQIGFAETAMTLLMPEEDESNGTNGQSGHRPPCPFYQLVIDPPMIPPFVLTYKRTDNGLFIPFEPPPEVRPLSERAAQLKSLIREADMETTTLFQQAIAQFGLSIPRWYVYFDELDESHVVKTHGKVRLRMPS